MLFLCLSFMYIMKDIIVIVGFFLFIIKIFNERFYCLFIVIFMIGKKKLIIIVMFFVVYVKFKYKNNMQVFIERYKY